MTKHAWQAGAQSAEIPIAVTGVGAIIGQGIIKSLRQSGHRVRVIGVDRNDNSPGPHLCDAFEKKPEAPEDSQAYLDYWERIVRKHGITLILPGLEIDMAFLNRHREFFAALGVRLALNSTRLISVTADKWNFGLALDAMGYPAIPSARPESWADATQALGSAPLILKPLHGNGSRGIVVLKDEDDFNYWRAKSVTPWMLQRIVGEANEEYTVGVFGLGDGRHVGPLTFRRLLSSAGNTLAAEVVQDHDVINDATEVLCQYFQPLGPTNFQFRVEGKHAYLLEINPRFSSSNSLRTAFGFNEAEMAIQFYLFDVEPAEPRITAGKAWRYTEDYVIHASHSL
ncbi:ATP-grasp domain-containing protein [Achromobacter sp. ES-001]|uniref:ATP-grasp domain-containing protein n=1 Tax=Achromobacter sp. ES-001 TaxID=2860286 RepID=UPI001C63F7AA|nr:ATP-grasp domain-containing protein [Achromobacter sp. ES-001]QYJ23705.1 ATP-grasp domain-containing protein [Achromobacter sp. ES-001]